MTARIGIELSAVACRIVELDAGPPWRRARSETRVTGFRSLPRSSPETSRALAGLRGRHATVVVWTAHNEHRQVVVANGSYERMRAEAREALRLAGLETHGRLCDVAPTGPHLAGMDRRTVLAATAPRAEVEAALRPLTDAGVEIDALLTPAAALTSLARMRWGLAVPDGLEAFVALEETVSTIALVRGGVLLAARDVGWGYLDDPPAHHVVRPRQEIAARLARELSAFVAASRFDGETFAQVCVCGGLPDLRSMTVPLMEQLDVEVETLDALFAIDAAHLPESADEFRERASELRLAWAAAADRRPPLDLFRPKSRQARKAALSRAAIVAGVAAGLGGGWALQRGWRPAERAPQRVKHTANVQPLPALAPQTRRLEPDHQLPVQSRAVQSDRPQAAQRAVSASPAAPAAAPPAAPAAAPPVARTAAPPIAPAAAPPAARTVGPAASPGSALAARSASRVEVPLKTPPLAIASRAATQPPPRLSVDPLVRGRSASRAGPSVEPPASHAASEPAQRSSAATPPRPDANPSASPRTGAEPARRGGPSASLRSPDASAPKPPEPPPLPFDAALATILYGPDRKLAIIDGRIVQAGDDVRGATIVEITPTAVLLRDAQGRLRRLTAGAAGK